MINSFEDLLAYQSNSPRWLYVILMGLVLFFTYKLFPEFIVITKNGPIEVYEIVAYKAVAFVVIGAFITNRIVIWIFGKPPPR